MRTRNILWIMVAVLVSLDLSPLRAQLTEDEKKRLFLKAREDLRPVPRPNSTPRPRPKPATTPRPKPQPTPEERKPTPEPDEPDRPDRSPAQPTPKPAEPDRPRSTPTPSRKSEPRPSAPIVIEKSGLEQDRGLEPAPKQSGGWFRRWRYLTRSVRRSIDRAPVQKSRWKYIVVHNSGTRQGNARIFDNYHRKVRKMENGLAYHFVIGNGTSSGDGEIEIGPRWTRQLQGGHVASNYLNRIAIGICLVGDFNRDKPTPAQLAALDELITYLRGRVGKIKGRVAIVSAHTDINPKPTDCPGDRFLPWVRKKYGRPR